MKKLLLLSMVLSLWFVGCTTNDNGYEVYKSRGNIYYMVYKTNKLVRVPHSEFNARYGLTGENTKNALIDGFLLRDGPPGRYDYSYYYELIKKEDYESEVKKKEESERIRIAKEKARQEEIKREKEEAEQKRLKKEAEEKERLRKEAEKAENIAIAAAQEEAKRKAEIEAEEKRLERINESLKEFDEFCKNLKEDELRNVMMEYGINQRAYEEKYKKYYHASDNQKYYRRSDQVVEDIKEIMNRYKGGRN